MVPEGHCGRKILTMFLKLIVKKYSTSDKRLQFLIIDDKKEISDVHEMESSFLNLTHIFYEGLTCLATGSLSVSEYLLLVIQGIFSTFWQGSAFDKDHLIN